MSGNTVKSVYRALLVHVSDTHRTHPTCVFSCVSLLLWFRSLIPFKGSSVVNNRNSPGKSKQPPAYLAKHSSQHNQQLYASLSEEAKKTVSAVRILLEDEREFPACPGVHTISPFKTLELRDLIPPPTHPHTHPRMNSMIQS